MEVVNKTAWRRTESSPTSVENAVTRIVLDAGNSEDGQLEALRAKISKLTEIVGALVAQSSDPVAILNAVDLGWEEAQ